MKNFKKHKFISKEKLAQLFNAYDINIQLYNVGRNHDFYDVNVFDTYKVGYCQYAVADKDVVFDIHYKNTKEDIAQNMNINRECKDIFALDEMQGYKGCTKMKPIYKIINRDGIPMDCDPLCLPSGRYNTVLIGILIK